MEIGTTIIGAALLVLCIVPLVLAHNKNKKTRKELHQELQDFAATMCCSITYTDIWPNHIIGIDDTKDYIFFMKNTGGVWQQLYADLNTIKNCYATGTDNPEIADVLEIVLVGKESKETILEFYNRKISMQVTGELLLIKKWLPIIEDKLRRH